MLAAYVMLTTVGMSRSLQVQRASSQVEISCGAIEARLIRDYIKSLQELQYLRN